MRIYFDETVDTFLENIDVLCVRNSQLGSDALAYYKPIIVIDTQGFDFLQNGLLLNKYAGCPIVQNEEQLINELEALKESAYFKRRLSMQFSFFNKLFKYLGHESDIQLFNFIENSNN